MHGFFGLSDAVFSPDKMFRYRLDRTLVGRGPVLLVCGVNPSKADAEINDHSVTKIIGLSQRQRASRFILVNEFAYCATDVREVGYADDPVGPKNDYYIKQAIAEADMCIVAWGPLAKLPPILRNRWRRVLFLIQKANKEPLCWGTAKDGHPRHPLMISYSTPLQKWGRPAPEKA